MLATREWVKSLLRKLNIGKYSNDEVRIGTWVDGKPVYRRTFKLDNITSTFQLVCDLADYNCERLIKVEGNILDNKGYVFPLCYYYEAQDWARYLKDINGTRLYIQTGANYPTKPFSAICIIEYTKTTD